MQGIAKVTLPTLYRRFGGRTAHLQQKCKFGVRRERHSVAV